MTGEGRKHILGWSAKYGHVSVEHEPKTPIQDDEPLFVVRARDRCAPMMVMAYAHANGGPLHQLALETREEIIKWQKSHPDLVKMAD